MTGFVYMSHISKHQSSSSIAANFHRTCVEGLDGLCFCFDWILFYTRMECCLWWSYANQKYLSVQNFMTMRDLAQMVYVS